MRLYAFVLGLNSNLFYKKILGFHPTWVLTGMENIGDVDVFSVNPIDDFVISLNEVAMPQTQVAELFFNRTNARKLF